MTSGSSRILFLQLDPAIIDRRMRKQLSLLETVGLGTALIFTCFFTVLVTQGYVPFDYTTYIRAASGYPGDYYYTEWLIPLLFPFSRLPLLPGYILFMIIGMAGIFFAGRIFSGDSRLAHLTYQALYNLSLGSTDSPGKNV